MSIHKTGAAFVVNYLDAAGAGPYTDLSTEVYTSAGVLVSSTAMEPTTVEVVLYISEDIIVDDAGEYTVVFNDSIEGVVQSEQLLVTNSVSNHLSPDVESMLSLPSYIVGDIISAVTAKVLTSVGVLLETLTSTYSATTAAYVTEAITVVDEGNYVVVWYDDGVAAEVTHLRVGAPARSETTEFWVGYIDDNDITSVAQANVLLTITKLGVRVATAVTDSSGYVKLLLEPAEYTVSLSRSGDVFSVNNFKATIDNTYKTTFNNKFQFISKHTTPTMSSVVTGATCELSCTLLNMDGTPLRYNDILVEQLGAPGLVSNSLSFNSKNGYKTDSNGYVSFSLLQGIRVRVTIFGIAFSRIITVPAESTADLLALLSATDDPLGIVAAVTDVAIRRSI